MKIKVILTLKYDDEDGFWDIEDEIKALELAHPRADIIIEDYNEVEDDEEAE